MNDFYPKFFKIKNPIAIYICLNPQVLCFFNAESIALANQIKLKNEKGMLVQYMINVVILLRKRAWHTCRSASQKPEYVIQSPWLSALRKAKASCSVSEALRSRYWKQNKFKPSETQQCNHEPGNETSCEKDDLPWTCQILLLSSLSSEVFYNR